ncbi:diguanylate cyclase [Synechococcus sp. RSCCF101]|uniref:diguanylate cyclase n=1 Tax=Synechococcus sp. RSCCF101 TaxID=2511069 RepID=UPI001248F097|nr:diguanylate cyclase [Synechococcus sp. RSCCF101]QEY31418.1 diguanylate cyclase [Synechococcus sp. RSCCF101]
MKGDIRIARGEVDALTDIPLYVQAATPRFRTVYLLLRDLCRKGRLNNLFEDFFHMVGVPAAIVDLAGNVLASSRWQRICRDFHREHAESCRRCTESDTQLANQLEAGSDFTMYRCRNGLTDCASPIIIEGEHVANLFIGQFLLEEADRDQFRQQAAGFGFDERAYLEALSEVPVVQQALVPSIMGFLVGFARLITALAVEQFNALEAEQAHRRHLEEQVQQRTRELKERTVQLENARNDLARQARIDGLTLVANRRALDGFLESEWRRLARSRRPLSLLMIDVDHFKAYNDRHGHPAGDACLVTIARLIAEVVQRPTDLVARYGGEEFACVLSDTDQRGALHIAEAIRQRLAELNAQPMGSQLLDAVTVSIGVATCTPALGTPLAGLIEGADRCLYRAKRSGRNRVCADPGALGTVAMTDGQPGSRVGLSS